MVDILLNWPSLYLNVLEYPSNIEPIMEIIIKRTNFGLPQPSCTPVPQKDTELGISNFLTQVLNLETWLSFSAKFVVRFLRIWKFHNFRVKP